MLKIAEVILALFCSVNFAYGMPHAKRENHESFGIQIEAKGTIFHDRYVTVVATAGIWEGQGNHHLVVNMSTATTTIDDNFFNGKGETLAYNIPFYKWIKITNLLDHNVFLALWGPNRTFEPVQMLKEESSSFNSPTYVKVDFDNDTGVMKTPVVSHPDQFKIGGSGWYACDMDMKYEADQAVGPYMDIYNRTADFSFLRWSMQADVDDYVASMHYEGEKCFQVALKKVASRVK